MGFLAKSKVKDQYIHIRVDAKTKAKARGDAEVRGLTMSEYIALIINAQ